MERVEIMIEENIGLQKKSFSICYKGGEIWIEHLDAIQNTDLLKEKFLNDLPQIKRPSTSSYIAINLDQSNVNAELVSFIVDSLSNINKSIRKVVFVGLSKELKKLLYRRKYELPFVINCIDDFEEAKEWLF